MENIERWEQITKSCSIKGLDYALAKRRTTSGDLSTFVDTNDEWISSRTGICVRYISEEENTSDLGTRAARMAVDKPSIDPKGIDLIITAAFTPDQMTSSTACLIQEKLGLNKQHMMAFDLNAACSDFPYVLQSAHVMLAAGQVTCTLIVGAEVTSKQLDRNNRFTCIIFADGTGATIVKQEDTSKRMLHFAGSMGDAADAVRSDASKPRPLSPEQPYQPSVVCMEGNATFRFATKAMQEVIEDVSKQAEERIENIDWIIPHQASVGVISNVCRCMHIDREYVHISIEEYENTSAVSIPPVLGEMSEKGLLQPGMKIVLSGSSASFIWTGCYIEL